MIGVKVSYVLKGSIKSWNLAVRGYNPSSEQLEGGQVASELIMEWCNIILKEFKITAEEHVLTSCTDSGSDVKRALEKFSPLIVSGVFLT